ncbi:MAG: diguanylate cyclase [Campylobacterota bacterium]|nr:diguanylate cyclase [Campylobacterota bacterium]
MENQEKSFIYRLNLYIPLVLVTSFMSIITIIMVIYFQKQAIYKYKSIVPKQFELSLKNNVERDAAVLAEYIKFIQKDKLIEDGLKNSDKKKIYKNIEKTFQSMNKNLDLTHMYFMRTDGTILLRVHDYNRDGDFANRTTFKEAQKSQQLFYGLEFGIKKNYTLRVVKPWIVNGELIGYIELGKEIDKILDTLSKLLETEIYMATKKDIFANSPSYVKNKLLKMSKTDSHYIVYNTTLVPEKIGKMVDGSLINSDIMISNDSFYVSRSVLTDVSGKDLGYFIFLSNITLEYSIMNNAVMILSIVLAFVGIIFLASAYIIIKQKEQNINSLTTELNIQKDDLKRFNSKLQKLFDTQSSITILTNTKSIHMANQIMLDFFGFKNLDEFNIHNKCICDRFIDHNNYFHVGKIDKKENWIDELRKIPEKEQVVAMMNDHFEIFAFRVSFSEFEEGEYIVTFADITDTMMEQIKLEYKVTHDKLTGAYNREFFDRMIHLLIKKSYPENLGIVLCDIDHFKNVNDTYGHDCGDDILVKVVETIQQSIRKDDYLIRWAGEEFILLMKIDTIDSFRKVLENIRTKIEKKYFDNAEHITCSFGGTFHLEDEDIMKTVKRSDLALYKAKDSGRNQVQIL